MSKVIRKRPHRHRWVEISRIWEQAQRGPLAGCDVVTYTCKCGKTKEDRFRVD